MKWLLKWANTCMYFGMVKRRLNIWHVVFILSLGDMATVWALWYHVCSMSQGSQKGNGFLGGLIMLGTFLMVNV